MSGESHQALARLAGRDVASIVHSKTGDTLADDEKAAKAMISRFVITPDINTVYSRLVRHLQESDITVNFFAYKFFNRKPGGTGYVSMFERGGGNIAWRDQAEEAMFDYSAATARPANVPWGVNDRIKVLGKLDRDTFEPSMRPKYAALNYARLRYGAAGANWGESFMVFKDHVKHNATYLHTDSFDASGNATQKAKIGSQVASFLNMGRLLANMPENMFKALFRAMQGAQPDDNQAQVNGLGPTQYIEAQVHGDLLFNRDIEKIVIAIPEIMNAQAKTQLLSAQGFKVITADKLRENVQKFSRKYGIPVEIV